MASYRYERDIDPKDIAPRRERQYTRKERWANWWDYNLKWVIIIGIAAAFVAYNFIGQYFFVTKPDHNVAVVAPYYLPEDTVNALQDALAAYGEDRNGDGKVVVTLNVYTLDYSDTETQTESAAYLTMAGTTKLAADVQGGLSSVFLLWDPAGFEESTGSLRYLDGTLPAADSDEDWWNMVYKWDDCPVLAGLDLGDYGPDTTQSRSGSSQEYMSQFYVGMRGAWNSGTADNLAGGEEFWQKLTEGASILGLFVMGVLVTKWTTINVPLVVSQTPGADGATVTMTVQNILDQLCPGLLALGLTLLMVRLLNKKVNPVWLIFALFGLGIIGNALGFLS